MKPFTFMLAGAALISGVGSSQAQNTTILPAGTNLAIPVVRIDVPQAAAPTPPPPKITGFADIIRAKFPLAIKYSDLGVGWRVLSWNATYFTKGETTILNNEEYLVAYLAEEVSANVRRLDTKAYIKTVTVGEQGGFAPEDRFSLTLLKMDQVWRSAVDGQTGLKSFSPDTANPEPAIKFTPPLNSPAYRQALSLLYLGKIYQAVNAYTQTYLGVTPPTESAFAAQQALLPFVENDAIFNQGGTSTPFKVNPLFSERKREHLRGRGRQVLFYEAAPSADGMRAVLLFDGTTRRVDADAWKRLSKASELE